MSQLERCTLLKLPLEIRRLILEHLLRLEEPVFFQSRVRHPSDAPRQLWPEIICCCRQLRAEGAPILYSNTIGIRIAHDKTHVPSILGQRYGRFRHNSLCSGARTLPDTINRMSSVDIGLWLHRNDLRDRSDGTRAAVQDVTELMNRQPTWLDINVRVLAESEGGESVLYTTRTEELTAHAFINIALRPLKQLRGRRNITTQNVPHETAEMMRDLLPRTGPVFMIEEAYLCLKAWYEREQEVGIFRRDFHCNEKALLRWEDSQRGHIERRFEKGVGEALELYNIPQFMCQRQILLYQGNLLNVWRNAMVFRLDSGQLEENRAEPFLDMQGCADMAGGLPSIQGVNRIGMIHRHLDFLASIPFEAESFELEWQRRTGC